MAMPCGRCGRPNTDSARACLYCGDALEPREATPAGRRSNPHHLVWIPSPEAGSDAEDAAHALAIDAMREYGVLRRGSHQVRDDGAWQSQYMFTLGLIIGGGTAQIQKNIISERGLGLPREPR